MKARIKLLIATAVVAVGLAALAAVTTSAVADPNLEVSLCHVPPGNPGNVRAVSVSDGAAGTHLTHGDFYNLDGAWAGPFDQAGWLYPIDVSFDATCSPAGAVVASVNYPEFADCSGTWTLVSATGTGYVVEEQLGGSCYSGCQYQLTFDPTGGQLHLAGIADSCPDAPETWSAVLSRIP